MKGLKLMGASALLLALGACSDGSSNNSGSVTQTSTDTCSQQFESSYDSISSQAVSLRQALQSGNVYQIRQQAQSMNSNCYVFFSAFNGSSCTRTQATISATDQEVNCSIAEQYSQGDTDPGPGGGQYQGGNNGHDHDHDHGGRHFPGGHWHY